MTWKLKWCYGESHTRCRSFSLASILFTLCLPDCNIYPWIYFPQDRCKLPWYGRDQQNAIHSRSGEVWICHSFINNNHSIIGHRRYLGGLLVLLRDSALCSVLGVDLPEPRKGVLLELYVQTVLFCREHSFNKEQTSTLLSIIKSIHEANVGKQSSFILTMCSQQGRVYLALKMMCLKSKQYKLSLLLTTFV